jgi:eukaryotic-like serine/threonine-protein kinase
MSSEISSDLRSVLEALAHAPSWPAAVPVKIAPGDRIGRYVLERVIGRGGFGIVFAAHDETLHRKVAIKVTRGEPTGAVLERFEREARIAARLNHPALVTLHDTGTIEGLPYLVLELLEGETLAARIARSKIDLDGAIEITFEILGAVAEIHAAGIVHLDLKPANVFLSRTNRVKVLDFGLAELRGVTAINGGTRGYMAPEQTAGGAPDARSDVYAVGVILLELMFGEHRDPKAMGLAPMRVRPVLARALAKLPEQRYPDGKAMLAAVAALRVPNRTRRRAVVAAGVVAAACVATAVPIAVSRWDRSAMVDAATLAGRAGREAEAIEARLRYARMQPLHDIRGEEAAARLELAVLAIEVGRGGDPAGESTQVALASAERAVHDLAAAQARLERVIARAPSPAASHALGDVLLDEYNEAMALLWYVSDRDKLLVHAKQLAALRDEGLRDLRDSVPTDPLTLARIEIFEGRMPKGVELAHAALAADPGLYEADFVIGGAYAELGVADGHAGKREDAISDFERANAAFVAGATIARSAPELHDGACRALQLELDYRRQFGNVPGVYDAARAACARASIAHPNDPVATTAIAYLDEVHAAAMMERGEDPQPALQDGFAMLSAALAVEPNNFMLLDGNGVLAIMAANADVERNRDPRPNLAIAEQAFTATNALSPDTHAGDMLGQIAAMRAEDTLSRGGDPRPDVKRAVELLAHGDVDRRNVFIGRALIARATWETQHDLDPHEALDGAIEAFHTARAASPHNMAAVDEEGGAWQAKAAWERKQGGDGIASLDKAIECSQVVLAADADDLEGHGNLGAVLIERAEAELGRGGDARPFVEQALAHLERAHAIDKKAPSVNESLASAHKLMAQLPPKK